MSTAPANRLTGVDALRGLAALAVCWFHLTNGNPAFPGHGWLQASGRYGWLGVDVFFVISGFIIPYSMARRGYLVTRDAGRFIVKRILRLDPPYFVAAGGGLALWYLSSLVPGFRGTDVAVSAAQVIAHVGYLNGFLGLPWLSPVFWSLAIEFQFYLAMALLFPLVAHGDTRIWAVTLAALWSVAMLLTPATLVLHYLGLFGCGLACFLFYTGKVGRSTLVAITVLMAIPVALRIDVASAVVAAVTALTIAWGRGGTTVGSWFGRISYSLYLVHVPIGGRVINAGTRLSPTPEIQLLVVLAAFAASITAAVLLHHWVEAPAQRWAERVGYRRWPIAPASAATQNLELKAENVGQ